MADETIYGQTSIDGVTLEEIVKVVADVVSGHNHDGINSRLMTVGGNPGIAGTGSATNIPRFTGGSSIGNSIMEELNNDTIHITGDFDVDGSGSFGESLLVVGNFDVQGVLSGDGSGLTNLPTAVSASHALQADSASHALTASFVEGVSAGARTGSYTGTFVGSASHAENADTAVLAVSAVTALTASLANVAESGTGSFTGSFIGTFDGKVPSESRVYHELVDDGIFSASFTMSFENTNFRKMRAGANVDVSFTGLAVGQVCVLEIDNIDDHIVIFTDPENIWSEGIVPNTPTGSSILSIVEITVGTALSFPFKDVK